MVRERKYAFVNQSYKPTKNDLICLFKVAPEGMSLKEAANNVALESSVGTWTPVSSNQNPSIPIASLKELACSTASLPIILSLTNIVRSGLATLFIFFISSIKSVLA